MSKQKKDTIQAKGFEIQVYTEDFKNDYISLTDIAKYKSDEPNDVIRNWMRGKDTIEFLGLWETLNNPNFNPVEFDGIKNEAGSNAFTLSPKKWIENTNAIGIVSNLHHRKGDPKGLSLRSTFENEDKLEFVDTLELYFLYWRIYEL